CMAKPTVLRYGLTAYSRDELESAISGITCADGEGPLHLALEAAGDDFKNSAGNIAIIVISDDKQTYTSVIASAEKLKERYGDRLCIYTVLVGKEGPDLVASKDDCECEEDVLAKSGGRVVLEQAAAAGVCGFYVDADELLTPERMTDFVMWVFLSASPDSDGDGVPDYLDKCPDTPRGEKVDKNGCPPDSDGDGVPDYLDKCPDTPAGAQVDADGCVLDSDGDGVPDYLDQCPETPMGVTVNEVGCWVLVQLVQFDFDKYDLKTEYFANIDEVITHLENDPSSRLLVEGHTCSLGTEQYNQRLSERRAQAVVDYLVSKDIAEDRLESKGYGEALPIAPNDTEENRSNNRRVQLTPVR
ncbi:OmpA family protein, partial [Thermodesulfobacteriota bacterium]